MKDDDGYFWLLFAVAVGLFVGLIIAMNQLGHLQKDIRTLKRQAVEKGYAEYEVVKDNDGETVDWRWKK